MFQLPSRQRQRARARNLLTAEKITETMWRVSGGDNIHIVSAYPQQSTYTYICDCGFTANLCSHKLAVMIQVEPDKMDWRKRDEALREAARIRLADRDKKRKERKEKANPKNKTTRSKVDWFGTK